MGTNATARVSVRLAVACGALVEIVEQGPILSTCIVARALAASLCRSQKLVERRTFSGALWLATKDRPEEACLATPVHWTSWK